MRNFIKLFCTLTATSLLVACASDTDEDAENLQNPQNAQIEQSQEDEPQSSIIGVDYKDEPIISYVRPRYLTDPQTRTIAEVFTGDELTYGQLTLRTNPNKRAGMYFFVMFDYGPDDIALASQIELSVDSSDSAHPRTFKFLIPETSSVMRELRLGVTGSDWKNPDAKVNAWKIVVKSPSGKILTQKQSWLWSLRNPKGEEISNPELSKKYNAAATAAQEASSAHLKVDAKKAVQNQATPPATDTKKAK